MSVTDPLAALAPDHPPDAVQLIGLVPVALQVSVTLPPAVIDDPLALKFTVGFWAVVPDDVVPDDPPEAVVLPEELVLPELPVPVLVVDFLGDVPLAVDCDVPEPEPD